MIFSACMEEIVLLRIQRVGALQPWNGGPHGFFYRKMGGCGKMISKPCMMGPFSSRYRIRGRSKGVGTKDMDGETGYAPCGTMARGELGKSSNLSQTPSSLRVPKSSSKSSSHQPKRCISCNHEQLRAPAFTHRVCSPIVILHPSVSQVLEHPRRA